MAAGSAMLGGILLVFGVLAGLQGWMARRARAIEGHEVPALLNERGLGGDGLLWFHSPTCGPCKAMEPIIRTLAAQGQAHVVDVSVTPEIAMACGVMGTPTTLALHQGRIVEVAPGVVPPAEIHRLAGLCA